MDSITATTIVPPHSLVIASLISTWLELLLLHPLVLLVSTINLAILSSTRIIHPNLRFILQTQSATIVAFEIYRLISIAAEFIAGNIFDNGPTILQRYGLLVTVFRNSLGHILLIERLLATFFYRKYEKYHKNHFSITWFCILATIALVNSATTTQSMDFTLGNFVSSLLLFFMSFLEYLSILLMGFYNKHKYNRFLPEGQDYSLSEKYQLAENIRTSRQLGPAFFCHLLNNAILTVGGGLMFLGFLHDYQYALVIQICILLSSFVDLAIEVTVITHHRLLRKRFYKLVRRIFLCKSENRVGDNEKEGGCEERRGNESPPKNVNGQILVRPDNPDGHFQMLARAWHR